MSSLLSFFKKKKRVKTPAEVAEDAVKTLAGSKNTEPVRCAPILSLPYSPSEREPVTIRLLQGASDSKPANRETRTPTPSLKESSSTEARYSRSNVASQKQERVSVPQFHEAHFSCAEQSLNSTAAPRLYPDLKPVDTKTKNSPNVRKDPWTREASSSRAEQSLNSTAAPRLYPRLKSSSVKADSPNAQNDPWTRSEYKQTDLALKIREVAVLKSIHDIAGEIKCLIQPRIIFSSEIDKKYERLKSNAVKDVTMMMSMLTNSSMLDYNFDNESKVQSDLSHVTKYIKFQSFKDVQKHHEELKKPKERQREGPAFPTYFQKLRCYKGKKGDVVDCD